MRKKCYLILSLIMVILLLLSTTIQATDEIIANEIASVEDVETKEEADTEQKEEMDTEEEVSDRHMAIASALAYVPLQKGKKMSEDFDINKFKLVSTTVNFVNAKFNLHDYATIHEMDDWIVEDYRSKQFSEKSMTVFVLRKENNLMIVFRGTDFEALADVGYGLQNYHNQEKYADSYVLSVLKKYSKEEGNFNIYVTGHSLGGYLAQTAGATIAQNIEKYPNLNLVKIVDFNGMGINFLTYFGEKYNYGNQAKTIETLTQLGKEGKLIEYYTYGDLVSALGVHYGEMRRLLPSIDSIAYHRANYKLLGDLNQKLKFGNKTEQLLRKDRLNALKTEVFEAKNLYQLNESIVAYLNLTHEADTFVTIDLDKAQNEPTIKIIENNTVLSSHIQKAKTKLEITKSTTLKAITNYASVKKYEWYVSTDKENWKLVATSTIDVNDEKYDATIPPTNLATIDINSFAEGETKYFKVIGYYDDNYVSSTVSKNEKTKQYEYVENEEKSKNEERKTVETVIEVKRKAESKIVKAINNIKTDSKTVNTINKIKTESKTVNAINKIKAFFKSRK